MKLRIKGNSIRYRLTKTDVQQLQDEGTIKETVSFGDDELHYVLQLTAQAKLTADFKNNSITAYMPHTMLTELANTERVGFDGTHGNLHILIEKDFTCLDNVAEDQSDNYPNPLLIQNHEQD